MSETPVKCPVCAKAPQSRESYKNWVVACTCGRHALMIYEDTEALAVRAWNLAFEPPKNDDPLPALRNEMNDSERLPLAEFGLVRALKRIGEMEGDIIRLENRLGIPQQKETT